MFSGTISEATCSSVSLEEVDAEISYLMEAIETF